MKGSIIRPLLMVGFVMTMVFLLQKDLDERKELQKQQAEIDPNSVIYSDIELIEGSFPDEASDENEGNTEESFTNDKQGAVKEGS